MHLKVFTLIFDPDRGGFDDTPMTKFLADKTVLGVHEHFFVHEHQPVWALLVTYREPSDSTGSSPQKSRTDWRATLGADDERALYDTVHRWRSQRAKRDGRPPYMVLTNRQIVDLVRRRPTTIAELHKTEGFGDARVADYGEELVALLKSVAAPTAPAPEPPAQTEKPDAP